MTGELFDAPNQQTVRADGSGPGVEEPDPPATRATESSTPTGKSTTRKSTKG
jgi:hypothetical protein